MQSLIMRSYDRSNTLSNALSCACNGYEEEEEEEWEEEEEEEEEEGEEEDTCSNKSTMRDTLLL